MENEHNLLPSELHDPHGSHGQKVLKERKFVEGDRLHETQKETIRLERVDQKGIPLRKASPVIALQHIEVLRQLFLQQYEIAVGVPLFPVRRRGDI